MTMDKTYTVVHREMDIIGVGRRGTWAVMRSGAVVQWFTRETEAMAVCAALNKALRDGMDIGRESARMEYVPAMSALCDACDLLSGPALTTVLAELEQARKAIGIPHA
jgi:hypothetical protein